MQLFELRLASPDWCKYLHELGIGDRVRAEVQVFETRVDAQNLCKVGKVGVIGPTKVVVLQQQLVKLEIVLEKDAYLGQTGAGEEVFRNIEAGKLGAAQALHQIRYGLVVEFTRVETQTLQMVKLGDQLDLTLSQCVATMVQGHVQIVNSLQLQDCFHQIPLARFFHLEL